MLSIIFKELNYFFTSLIGYTVIGVFLIVLGLIIWVFPDTSLLNSQYASLDQLFDIAPIIFLFLIPALTMRTFSEENQAGTIETLLTRPITHWQIILGKYFSTIILIIFAILPTVLYYYTVVQLGSPVGNIDSGAVLGSYLGLVFLAASFASIGIFASSLTQDQISAFLLALFLCFIVHWGFFFLSSLPIFVGKLDHIVQMLGSEYHYLSISRGLIDTRDLVYFFSVIIIFLSLTVYFLNRRQWK